MSKYKQVKINLTPEHYTELEEKAVSNNISIAEYIRQQLSIDLKVKPKVRKKRTDSTEYKKADPQLLYHLAKIGNNLNQIARSINQGQELQLATLIDIREQLNDYIS